MSISLAPAKFEVCTTKRNITAQAGAVLIRETARVVGLGEAIQDHVHLKKRARGLSEAQTILSMSEAIAMGAECLDDLDIARSDKAQQTLRGFGVPAPQTAGTFLRRFTLGHIRQFEKALRQVHQQAFACLDVAPSSPWTSIRPTSKATPHAAREPTPPISSATPCIRCSALSPSSTFA